LKFNKKFLIEIELEMSDIKIVESKGKIILDESLKIIHICDCHFPTFFLVPKGTKVEEDVFKILNNTVKALCYINHAEGEEFEKMVKLITDFLTDDLRCKLEDKADRLIICDVR